VEEGSEIHPQASLVPPLFIGANCQIKEGAKLEKYAVLGDNCIIDKGVKLKRTVLWKNNYVGKSGNIGAAVIAKNCYLQSNVQIFEGAVLGDNCKVEGRAQIKNDIKIWPGKQIQWGTTVVKNLVWGDCAKSLFTSQAVKGLVNVELTVEFMARLGSAYGAFLSKGSTVLVASDGTRSTRMLHKALISGLVACGVNAYDLESLPLPVVKYAVGLEDIEGGVFINTCENNAEYIEIRFFDGKGVDLSKNHLKKIETIFLRGDFRKINLEELGEIEHFNGLCSSYTRSLLKSIQVEEIRKKKLKLVLEYNYSNSCLVLPSMLKKLGCEVISLNAYVDEEKSFSDRNKKSDIIQQLSTMVVATNSDLGILLDGTGEKIFLVDEEGKKVDINKLLLLLSYYRLEKFGTGSIALPVTAPWFMEGLLQKKLGTVLRSKATYSSLLALAKKEKVLLAGNEQGAFVFPEFQAAFDGMRALGEILEMLTKKDSSLVNLLDNLPKLICLQDSIFCSWGFKGKVMRSLIQEVGKEKVDLLDGIRIFSEESSILILPDGEQPIFHLFAEGTCREKVLALLEKYLHKIRKEQNLPEQLRKVR